MNYFDTFLNDAYFLVNKREVEDFVQVATTAASLGYDGDLSDVAHLLEFLNSKMKVKYFFKGLSDEDFLNFVESEALTRHEALALFYKLKVKGELKNQVVLPKLNGLYRHR